MKDILTTALGMFMFGDVMLEVKNLLGVLVGLVGGITYGALQYHASQTAKSSKPGYRPLPSSGAYKGSNPTLTTSSLGSSIGSFKGAGHQKAGTP